jgi:transcriptional regulator GlxA family with amidase domain
MNVHFVILPNVYLLDLAGIADALRNANRIAGRTLFDCTFHGVAATTITSIGIPLAALAPLPDRLADDALIVLTGVTPMERVRDAAATEAVRWLRQHAIDGRRVACVCAGAFLAGRAGLLDERACTTHHEDCDALQVEFPRALVRHNRVFVVDGPILTSAGVTAGIDLALHLIAEAAGPVVASQVARTLVVYMRRTSHDAQLSPWFAHRNHLHPIVHRAQDAILADPTRDWTLASLADAANTSVRHLTRLFRDEAGVTVLDYLQRIRVGIARERLETSSLTIERVAEAAGFHSAHQLRRAWKRHADGSPARTRDAFDRARAGAAVSGSP